MDLYSRLVYEKNQLAGSGMSPREILAEIMHKLAEENRLCITHIHRLPDKNLRDYCRGALIGLDVQDGKMMRNPALVSQTLDEYRVKIKVHGDTLIYQSGSGSRRKPVGSRGSAVQVSQPVWQTLVKGQHYGEDGIIKVNLDTAMVILGQCSKLFGQRLNRASEMIPKLCNDYTPDSLKIQESLNQMSYEDFNRLRELADKQKTSATRGKST